MLKAIGNTRIQPLHRASCHCGAVVLEIRLPKGLPDPHRCDCSFCKRKGAIVAAVPEADLKVVKGEPTLRKYQFGKKVAEHFFCVVCGIYTHHRRSTNPQEFGFNIGCLKGVNPYDLGNVPVRMVGRIHSQVRRTCRYFRTDRCTSPGSQYGVIAVCTLCRLTS